MNQIPTIPPVSPSAAVPPASPNWRTAIADLVAARLGIFQIEGKEAAASGIKRVAFFAAAAILLLFAWGLIIVGIIGAISGKGGFAWYWVTLIAGAIHLLLAVTFVMLGKRPSGPAFPILRAEFNKDRVWLEKFQTPKKFNN